MKATRCEVSSSHHPFLTTRKEDQMKKFITTFALLAMTTQLRAENVSVWILAGQSNQAEFAYATDPMNVLERHVLQPNDDIFYRPTSLPLQSLAPLTLKNEVRFGPELSFGRHLQFYFPEKIAIIKYAIGSTSLENDWDPVTGERYALMMNRVIFTMNYLESLGHTPKIKGFNWIQGEEDARVAAFAPNYASNLEQMFNAVRSDFADSELPIVLARINAPGRPYRHIVRDAQVQVAESMHDVTWLDTDSLPLRDNVHYSAKGQYTLGKEFAEAYVRPDPFNPSTVNWWENYSPTNPWRNQSAVVPEPVSIALVVGFVVGFVVFFFAKRTR